MAFSLDFHESKLSQMGNLRFFFLFFKKVSNEKLMYDAKLGV